LGILPERANGLVLNLRPSNIVRSKTKLLPGDKFQLHCEGVSMGWNWFDQDVILCVDGQDFIDIFVVFKASYDDTSFDLLLFDQRKLRTSGGLVFQTYKEAIPFCRDIVKSYTQSTGTQAGFLFGVVDPVKFISTQLKNKLSGNEELQLQEHEFVFALGRNECSIFHNFLDEKSSANPICVYQR
jgi:hypothetical protein